jgi:hypothetical protein
MRELVTLLPPLGFLSTYKRWTAVERPIKAAVQPERFKAMQDSRGAVGRNDRPGLSIHRGRRLARSFAPLFLLQNLHDIIKLNSISYLLYVTLIYSTLEQK